MQSFKNVPVDIRPRRTRRFYTLLSLAELISAVCCRVDCANGSCMHSCVIFFVVEQSVFRFFGHRLHPRECTMRNLRYLCIAPRGHVCRRICCESMHKGDIQRLSRSSCASGVVQ